MAQTGPSAEDAQRRAQRHVRRTARKASPWIERLARFGYAAYGLVYVLVGVLSFRAALGDGGTSGQEGALRSILFAPFGRVLLGLVALGLLVYALWRLFQGVLDPDGEGSDAKGIVKRFDHGINGLFHGALAFSAGQLALGSGGGGGGGSPDDWTAQLMAQPLGRWLALAVGAIAVCAGLYQFYAAYKTKFMEHMKPGEMGPRERTWATRAGRLGYAARGVVFGVIGVFLVQAAMQFDPQQARGLGGALSTVARQPFGPYLLGGVALGLISYGAFMFVVARYRRIDPA